jgi:hypothetical protein
LRTARAAWRRPTCGRATPREAPTAPRDYHDGRSARRRSAPPASRRRGVAPLAGGKGGAWQPHSVGEEQRLGAARACHGADDALGAEDAWGPTRTPGGLRLGASSCLSRPSGRVHRRPSTFHTAHRRDRRLAWPLLTHTHTQHAHALDTPRYSRPLSHSSPRLSAEHRPAIIELHSAGAFLSRALPANLPLRASTAAVSSARLAVYPNAPMAMTSAHEAYHLCRSHAAVFARLTVNTAVPPALMIRN